MKETHILMPTYEYEQLLKDLDMATKEMVRLQGWPSLAKMKAIEIRERNGMETRSLSFGIVEEININN